MHRPEPEHDVNDAEPARWGLSRVLRLATGVREEILDQVPSERARYTSMGGVVAGTAIMAMLSMTAALYWVFGGFRFFIVLAVPVWGLFILSLDRWLMTSTTMGQGARAAGKLLARLFLSIALGVVLAEPLLLGVYGTAIDEKIAKDRQQEIQTRESDLRTCNPIPGTPEAASPAAAEARCAQLRLSLAGDSPEALQKQLDTATRQAKTLQTTMDNDGKAYAELEAEARKECNGTSGVGLTGEFGEGPNCDRLRAEATKYRSDHQIDENGKRLSALNQEIKDVGSRLGTARVTFGKSVDTAIDKELDAVRGRQGRVGLLERFRALDELVAANAYVAVTMWSIRIFFILVDALPIILKALSGRTAYDRLVDERLGEQEQAAHIRTVENLHRHAQNGDLMRYRTDTVYRNQRDLIDEGSRVQRANLDERRGQLIDAFEQHLMRTAIGPANQGWSPGNGRVMEGESQDDGPTQELIVPEQPGAQW
ncbi:DUF4407 domain-containing protein [Actinoplanes auranticolor]|uniref:DUF4407 domain-containing protein n=1 Tax=Actinoplanes auranticolor TaxID=47988 RepID=A0A919VQU0_9ACTN|nr:DUF4407 domain-containing protein [Actinoplanes auranticolor]GIM65911.1 hypothetical protein Aau02nite_20630 [Actinoplanes auranticolor]